MDQLRFYNDFISYINENMVKVQELLEKVTMMHFETSKILLETCSLFHPQVLIELNEMDINGRGYDECILAGQEIKTKLDNLTSISHSSAVDYRQMVEEIELLNQNINTIQDI